MFDNTWVFAFVVAVLRRIGSLLGDAQGAVFLQVAEEIWKWFNANIGKDMPNRPEGFKFSD